MEHTIGITGANGAVGCAILERITRAGATVAPVACVRSARAESALPPLPEGGRVARIAYDDASSLERAFAGARAVIHLPGVLVERKDSSYEQANVATTDAALEAARKAGVEKLVLVSAVGADEHSANRYYATKGRAEARVRECGLAFTILRAPLVLGPRTEGSAALARYARSPRVFLLGGGRHTERPLDVRDLAAACLAAATAGTADGRTLELVGPEAVSYRELVLRAAKRLGNTPSVVSVPVGAVRFATALRTRLAGPGFSPDVVEVITTDVVADPSPAAAELGLELTPLADTLAQEQGDSP